MERKHAAVIEKKDDAPAEENQAGHDSTLSLSRNLICKCSVAVSTAVRAICKRNKRPRATKRRLNAHNGSASKMLLEKDVSNPKKQYLNFSPLGLALETTRAFKLFKCAGRRSSIIWVGCKQFYRFASFCSTMQSVTLWQQHGMSI